MLKLLLLASATLWAQPAVQFEVASIRPSPPITPELIQNGLTIGMKINGDRLTIAFVSITGLLEWAYDVKGYQITGPDWIEQQRFNIDAILPANAGKDQVPALLRKLLEERFQLKIRREQKETTIYELTQAASGFKAKPAVPWIHLRIR